MFEFQYAPGIVLLKKGKLDEARKYFLAIYEKKPDSGGICFELGKINFKTGDMAGARFFLNKYLNLDKSDAAKRKVLEITGWRMVGSLRYFNHSPAFSPDGRWLAYAAARQDTNGDGKIDMADRPGIFLYDLLSDREYELLDNRYYNSMPIFSPDGRNLLYLSARSVGEGGEISNDSSASLYISDIKTGVERKLLIDGKIKHPSFSYDGKKVVYCVWKPAETVSRICCYDLETDIEYPVTTGVFESTFPHFSPDGRHVIYSSWRSSSTSGAFSFSTIMIANIEAPEETVLTKIKGDNSFPQYSPDGNTVLYLCRRRDTNNDGQINSLDNAAVFIVNMRNKRESCLVDDRYYNKFPCFSYDGKKIIFISSWRRNSIFEAPKEDYFEHKGVYTVELKNRKIKNVISEKYYGVKSPAASPVESKIAYLGWRKNTGRGIFLCDYETLPSTEEIRNYIEKNLI